MFDGLANYISEVVRGKKVRVAGYDARWRKVANIKVGDRIAVPKEEALRHLGRWRGNDLDSSEVEEIESERGMLPENKATSATETDVLWDEIVSIKRLSPERVYDIEVEDTHNFIAGHFIDIPSPGTEAILTDEPGRGPPQSKDQDNLGSGKSEIFGGIFAHNTYISSSLGVGLSSPANKLDVSGGAAFGTYAGFTAPSGGIIVSGNVGVGTTGPSRQLSINHDTTPYQSFMVNSTEQFVIGSETGANTRDFIFYDTQGGAYRMVIDTSGRVGIGSTAPDNKLDVDGAVAIGTYGLSLTGNTAPPNGLIVSGSVGIGTSLPTAGFSLDVIGTIQFNIGDTVNNAVGVCKSSADSAGVETNVELGDCSGTASDIAELYPGEEGLLPGDVVSLSSVAGKHRVIKSKKAYDSLAIGIVSTDPVGQFGKPLGYGVVPEEEHPVPIVLSGRIPILVSLENGPIAIGDPLTTSSKPGIAMKATKFGRIIGYALDPFDGSVIVSEGVRTQETSRSNQVMKFNGAPVDPTELGVGKIITYFNLSYHYPELALNQDGSISPSENSTGPPDSGGINNKASPQGQEARLAKQLDELSLQVSSISASLAELAARSISFGPTFETASISATLANLDERVNFLEQIGIQSQTATSSAAAASTSATLDTLTVYGNSSLFDLSILNKFTAGLLTIDGVASDGASLSTLGVPLKLQNNLSGPIELMGGKVSIDTHGNLLVEETVKAKKFEVDMSNVAAASAGKAEIPQGETVIVIETTALTEESLIFVTPEGQPTPVAAEKTDVNKFAIRIPDALPAKLKVSWWIIN